MVRVGAFCLILIGLVTFLSACQSIRERQSNTDAWVETEHYAGWILQNWWGDLACNPVNTPGTVGQWGIAPEEIPGWPTGLTQADYKIEIRYHGNPNCCGDQSATSSIWIGGNEAESMEVNFVGPAPPATGYARVVWNGIEIAKTEKRKGQWHTLTATKKGNIFTLQLDGRILKTGSANSFPNKLIVGGQCWTGCQAPDLASDCLFGNWNNFGYDVRFYSAPITPTMSY